MKIEYDKIADALYICLKKAKVHKTIKMKDWLIVDVDSRGNVIGIEVLDASVQLPKKSIKELVVDIPKLCFV